MASITQTIPQYIGGISQQPDEKKLPGQLVTAQNILPDVTEGLMKRPGSKLISSMNSAANGKWFHYYRDENEQYIGQIELSTGEIKMWNCIGNSYHNAGAEVAVTYIPLSWSVDTTYVIGSEVSNNSQIYKATTESTGGAAPIHTEGIVGNWEHVTTTLARETPLKDYLKTVPTDGTSIEDSDLQTLTLNDYTYITNRNKPTAMKDLAIGDNDARPYEAFIELKKVSYASQYALNLFNDNTNTSSKIATRINIVLEKDSSNSCDSAGAMVATRDDRLSESTRCDNSAGESRDHWAPNVGTQVFSITDGGSLTDEAAVSGEYTYTIDVKDSSDNSVNRGKDLYFRITTTGQSVPYTSGSGDSQSTTYRARYTTTFDLLHGGSGWQQGDYFYVWMKDGYYKIIIEEISDSQIQGNLGIIRPTPTPFDSKTVVTAESILGALQTNILNATKPSDGLPSVWDGASTDGDGNETVQIIGNGIYLKESAAFNVTSPTGALLNVITTECNDIAELPTQCKHGYVVKVKNSDANEDDYYVKFFGENDKDGPGTWEECPKPGRKIAFDPATMPIQLIRQSGSAGFTVDQIVWENCLVGDETTVPEPSFIKTSDGLTKSSSNTYVGTINNMMFWRNRMLLLSDENVIMSQPGEFFNFWPKSAITYTATDVIDISVSSEFPAIIYDGALTNSGLILFSKNQQYLLTTDSDVLSPQTAKINTISTYNFNSNTNPVSLGTTTAFLDNAGKYTRLWEMANVLREGEPVVIDQTKVVSKLFDKELSLISNSRENSIIFFSKKNSSTLYGYKYFDTSEKRLQQAWFTWEITGTIQHHAILDDILYVVVRNNGKDTLQSFSIKINTDTITITDDKSNADATDDEIHRIHLDTASAVTIAAGTYSENSNKTTFLKPDGYEHATAQLCLYDNNTTSDYVGKYSEASIINNDSPNSTIEVPGDWSNRTVILGYLYDMQLEFPTIYYTQTADNSIKADTNGSLIIHRIKLNFGPYGSYTTIIDKLGNSSYEETWDSPISDQYLLSNVAIDDEVIRTVPIYERNKNLTIKLKSSHPSPATLYSMTWEGDFTNKFYQRV
tara:strand:+ start:3613 stop:6840 length:3228 start_codon:yes stop_codon:yes gene_type:complete